VGLCACGALVRSKQGPFTIYIKARSPLMVILLTLWLLFCDNYIITTLLVAKSPRWLASLAWILSAFAMMMEKEKVSEMLDFSSELTLPVIWGDCITWSLWSFGFYSYVCYHSLFIAAVSCILHFVPLLSVSHAIVNGCFPPQEWAAKQSTLKEEEIDITFSYWDGSGHRRTVRMKKGNWWPLMMYSDVWY